MKMLMPDYAELQKKNHSGFVVIGAGLPRTGTMSLRAALGVLLDGACHHMLDVFAGTNAVTIECRVFHLPPRPWFGRFGFWMFLLVELCLFGRIKDMDLIVFLNFTQCPKAAETPCNMCT